MSDEQRKKGLYYYRLGNNQISDMELDEQKQYISSFIKKQCVSENLHFFIGSGCSLPAVELMNQTFGKVKKSLEKNVLGNYLHSSDIEGYLNWLITAIKFHGEGTSEANLYYDALLATKKGLLKSIPKNYLMDVVSEKENQTTKNYQAFYNNVFSQREFKNLPPVNIFTTNYDLYNEIAMESTGIHYTNGFTGNVNRRFDPSVYRLRLVDDENRYKDKWSTIRRYIKMYKIHGSIDWKYDSKLKNIVQSNLNNESELYDNVMIYPTTNKHIETQQTPYSELFREFTINLQKKNSTLIVIGYGFPDEHINQLVSQSLNNEDFNLIVFGDVEEDNAKLFLEQHKGKHNFHFIGGDFKEENDGHHFHNVNHLLGGIEKDA